MTDLNLSSKEKVQLQAPPYLDQSNSIERSNGAALSTAGQLMRSTAQAVQHLYRDRLSHTPSRVTCDLIKDKLLIWVEDSVTRPELALRDVSSRQLPAVTNAIRRGFKSPLIDIVERHLGVKVVTLLSDVCYEQRCTAIVVLLSHPPRMRFSRTRH